MANINNRVKLWRGTRANYNALGTWDYWTEYNVKETNGTWTKYYGTTEVVGDAGELAPVEGILSPAEFGSLDASGKTQGSRWLVGSGDSYYVVEFGPNASVEAARIQPLGSYSVRVKDRGLKAYELVDGELYTYDVLFSSGNTVSSGQTIDEINFEEENGVMSGYVILDTELDENSPHAVANSAITKAIYEDEQVISAAFNDLNTRKADKTYVDAAISAATLEVDSQLDSASTNPVENRAIYQVIYENEEAIAAALNDLNDRLGDVEDANISGTGVISTEGDLQNGITISHDEATINEVSTSSTLANGGTFQAISNVKEDVYGHVTAVTATTYTLPELVTAISATGDTYVSASVANGSALTISTNEVTGLTDNQASGTVADSKAIVDYIKAKLTELKNVTAIGGVSVPTSATTYTVESGSTLIDVQTAADGASGIKTTITPVTAATSSSTVGLVTNEDVRGYIDGLLTSVMRFQGVANSLPASGTSGDVYIVGTQFAVGGDTAEVGDYLVYYQPEGGQGEWHLIEKNDTGVVTSTGLTANALVVADGSNSIVSAGTVGSATRPIYLNNGVPTPITEAASGTSELVYGSAVTLATIEGVAIEAELPELDTELDSGSTNGIQNSAITTALYEVEEVVAAALNDLEDRKADKDYVDEAISAMTFEVIDCAATIPVNSASASTLATVDNTDITAQVSMATITIAGANSQANGVTFDGTTDIEILVLDCGEY